MKKPPTQKNNHHFMSAIIKTGWCYNGTKAVYFDIQGFKIKYENLTKNNLNISVFDIERIVKKV